MLTVPPALNLPILALLIHSNTTPDALQRRSGTTPLNTTPSLQGSAQLEWLRSQRSFGALRRLHGALELSGHTIGAYVKTEIDFYFQRNEMFLFV